MATQAIGCLVSGVDTEHARVLRLIVNYTVVLDTGWALPGFLEGGPAILDELRLFCFAIGDCEHQHRKRC